MFKLSSNTTCDSLSLGEVESLTVLCGDVDGKAFLIEDIIKYFGYNEKRLDILSKEYKNKHEERIKK